MKKRLLPFLFLFPCALSAQYTSELTIQEIMKGEDFVGYLPTNIEWSVDSKFVYFSWNPENEKVRSLYKVNVQTNEISNVSAEEEKNKPELGDWTSDRTKMVYAKSGDLFLYSSTTSTSTLLTSTLSRENNPYFSGDEKNIIYTMDNNLFSWNMETGGTTQLTDFKKGVKPKDKKSPQSEKWLESDQLEWFDILNKRDAISDLRKEKTESLQPDRPLEIYMGSRSVNNIKASPDLKFVTYVLQKEAKSKRTAVPNYVTQSGYTDRSMSRPKVGSPRSTFEMGIYNVASDTSYTIDVEQIEGIFDKPLYLKDYSSEEEFDPQYSKPRSIIYHGPWFSDDGKALVCLKADDNKDRWIMLLDLETGKLTQIDRQHDDAWVGGPGVVSWNFRSGNMGWIDNETVWFQSEESGYSHLYTYNTRTKKKKTLTKGEFEIRDAKLSNDKQSFYIESNMISPHVRHFYKLNVSGGKMQPLTDSEGYNNVTLSPDESTMAIRYSFSNQPWELYLKENSEGSQMKQVTESTTEDFQDYDWRKPEIVRFSAEDGAQVPARLYKPSNPNGAAVIFVHGAGYLQNVHNWWSNYYREFMFHNYLADMGYTVLDIDYRGSDGYGRDWRTGIYRWMGGKDLSDQVDGAKYLVDAHGVDEDRIGIYGGSYGGFITLMAMFTSPGTFQGGAALRSVTDWAHYNHDYTSNILNTPVEDSIAYYKSSPIYHAKGLEGKLVMLHGVVDRNVQFQDVVRLSQRLIELGKTNWDLAVFPMEGHGFREASSWADEYRRIYELFEETLSKE